jgi:glyoxylase-like metal-dependent hydrolase (beta-lactamase superfamily II)
LHGGNSAIIPGAWQPLPGESSAKIWPYLRKVDTISSNSYCIESGGQVIVIDPGGLPEQAEELRTLIEALPGGAPRPVLVLLTHAHIDHCRALMDHPFFSDPDRVVFAIQEDGARALATADRRLTQAALMGLEIAPIRAALQLFSGLDHESCSDVLVPCGANGPEIRLSTVFSAGADGVLRAHQVLRAGSSCPVMLYHTPGHSPDSICIRIGSVLFIGDLMFAASPGVAGMSGWDLHALIRSIDDLLALLHEGGITHCCPGHGKIMTCTEAEHIFYGVKKDASALDGIEEWTPARAKETALYAEGLIEEVGEIFTIIAARLLYVSHVLEELEEGGEAGEVVALIDAARIDSILADFHRFHTEFRAGSKLEVHLALKAGQIVQKLEKMVVTEQLEPVLDPEYLQRALRLLCDYTTVLRGFRPPRMLQPVAVWPMVSGLIDQLKQSGPGDEDLISSADDPAAYTRALVRRIARVAIFDSVTVTCPPGISGRQAEVDRAILCDLIRTLLEDIAGTGTTDIALSVSENDHFLSIIIKIPQSDRAPQFREVRQRFLTSECLRGGGSIVWRPETGLWSVRIDLPSIASGI